MKPSKKSHTIPLQRWLDRQMELIRLQRVARLLCLHSPHLQRLPHNPLQSSRLHPSRSRLRSLRPLPLQQLVVSGHRLRQPRW